MIRDAIVWVYGKINEPKIIKILNSATENMYDIFIKFLEHLMFIGLCLLFIWMAKKLFLILLKKTVQAHIIYFDKKQEIKKGKCEINIKNITSISGEPSPHNSAKFGWVDTEKNYFCIRIYDKNLEESEQASNSIMLRIKPEEVPFIFAIKLISLILRYRFFKSGYIDLKLSKRMLRLIELKLDKIRHHNFNSKNLKQSEYDKFGKQL